MSVNNILSAVRKGDIQYVKRFLARNPDTINLQDDEGRTPLHMAVDTGNVAMVEMLINEGAYVHVGDNYGNIPLHMACVKGHTDTVKVLLKQSTCNVNVVNIYGNTPLHLACVMGHTDIVKVLLEQSTCNVNVVNKKYGSTPLHVACNHGHTDTVKVLLEQSTCNVNVVNNYGNTPLHLAVIGQNYDVVALMLSQGHQVQMEKKNSLQQTPFLRAVCGGDFELIHILVSNGADINAVGADGNNCLHLALGRKKFHSRREYLDVLDEFCSTLGLSKEDSLSPKVVASYLAGQGANLYHRNQKDKTPLDLIDDPDVKEKLVFFSTQSKCKLCEENHATVRFHPCGHKVTCKECCSKIKLKSCHLCRQPITRKSGFESRQLEVREPTKEEKQEGFNWWPFSGKRKQVESQQLEVREPTKEEKQEGFNWWPFSGKRKQVESPQLEVREPTKEEKQEGFKWWHFGRKRKQVESPSDTELLHEQVAQHLRIESHQAESPQLEVREPTKEEKQEGFNWWPFSGKRKQVESPQLEVREPTKEEKQEGFKWWHFGRKRKQVESPSDTELLHEQLAQHLRIESHQAESPQLEVREPTKEEKQEGFNWWPFSGKRKQVESQKLEVRDLMKVAKHIGVKWKQVGRFLEIIDNTLDIIKKDHQDDTEEQAYQMLLKWSQSCGSEKRTVDVLRDALKEAECYEAIKRLPSEE